MLSNPPLEIIGFQNEKKDEECGKSSKNRDVSSKVEESAKPSQKEEDPLETMETVDPLADDFVYCDADTVAKKDDEAIVVDPYDPLNEDLYNVDDKVILLHAN